jgi:hypothetical protein
MVKEAVVVRVVNAFVTRGFVCLSPARAGVVGSRPSVSLLGKVVDEAEGNVIGIGSLTVAAKRSASLALLYHQHLCVCAVL